MAKKELETEKSEKSEKVADKKPPKGKNKKGGKDQKPNFFVRLGRKIKETFSELKRVTWPSFGKAVKATGVVIVIVLIFMVLVTGVNFGFSKLLELLTGVGS